MDTVRRRSGATATTPTVSEAFWELVDANWSAEELAGLVALCKAMEDAFGRASRRD